MSRLRHLFFLPLMIACMITACKGQHDTDLSLYEFVRIKDTLLPLEGNRVWLDIDFRHSAKIICTNFTDKYILVKSLPSGKVEDSISLSTLGNRYKYSPLMGVHYVSKDSIYLLYYPPQGKIADHDSTFILINRSAKIIQAFSWKGANVPSNMYNPVFDRDTTANCFFLGHLPYENGKIILPLKNWILHPENNLHPSQAVKCGGHFNLSENKFYPHAISHPHNKDEYYSGECLNANVLTLGNGKVIYYFGHKGNLYEYDIHLNQYSTHKLQSALIDSIPPLFYGSTLNSKAYDNNDVKNAEYKRLTFNPFQKQFIRFYRLAPLKKMQKTLYYTNNPDMGFMVIDSNFRCIGEGFCTEKIDIVRVTEEGYWSSQYNDEGQKIYTIYQLKKKGEITRRELIRQREHTVSLPHKSGLDAYLHDVHGMKKKDALIFLVPDNACSPCIDFTINQYVNNIVPKKNEKVYLIVSTSNNIGTKSILKKYNVAEGTFHILYDKTGEYAKYVPADFESIHALTLKNGKIVKDQELPGQMTDLIPEIFEKFMKQK